jgi:uncharacterized protein YbjT (DUF2867 family)
MKIVITGSLGNISKPLTHELLQKGHTVTVISSNPEKQTTIEALGAKAAIGHLEDLDFITKVFTGADAAYTMIPPGNFFDHALDIKAHYKRIAANYAQAIEQTGIKKVVHLSCNGAHLEKNSGLILAHHEAELILKKLPDIDITFMRPTAFYYNLYFFINVIKNTGNILSNYGAADLIPWASPLDVAAAIAEELEETYQGSKVRYVVSDELTCNEAASLLGEAIGKPDLKWLIVSGEQMQGVFEKVGMNPEIASLLIEMNYCMHSGELFEDYNLHKPSPGKIKLVDFAKDFAARFLA